MTCHAPKIQSSFSLVAFNSFQFHVIYAWLFYLKVCLRLLGLHHVTSRQVSLALHLLFYLPYDVRVVHANVTSACCLKKLDTDDLIIIIEENMSVQSYINLVMVIEVFT